ncbi:hypothetical protein ACTD5D_35750 [Nocardia takedensis]|uniref:hypothetical protein n=1 Tax=Nocardia takedensis TaxID=259390 RepID=UPI0012F6CBA5|nr:hypothetical protein [Nocardia takedensis]
MVRDNPEVAGSNPVPATKAQGDQFDDSADDWKAGRGRRMGAARSSTGPKLSTILERAKPMLAMATIMVAATACGTGDFVIPTAESSSSTVTKAAAPVCPATNYGDDPNEKLIAEAITKAALPIGICLFMVDVIELVAEPGNFSVTIDLNTPASKSPNDLRQAATDIAYILKSSGSSSRISILDVTNWGAPTSPYRSLLTDENFQKNSWAGIPSQESDMALWKIVDTESRSVRCWPTRRSLREWRGIKQPRISDWRRTRSLGEDHRSKTPPFRAYSDSHARPRQRQ